MRSIAFLLFLTAVSLYAQSSMADIRSSIVKTALGLKGVPYVYGAESPPDALDCSGFVQYVFKKAAGLEIPRNSRQQWAAGYPIKMSEIRPGDVFVFDTSGSGPSHVALYLGDGSMIQAASEGPQTGVIVSSTSDRYWASRLLGARSFLDKPGAPEPPAAPAAAPAAPVAATVPPPAAAPAALAAAPVAAIVPPPAAAAPAAASPAPNPPAAAAPVAASPAPGLAVSSGAGPAADNIPVSELGFTLGTRASVVTDRIPTAAGSMLAFTLVNGTGRTGSFQIDFYKAAVDPGKNVSLKHLVLTIADKDHVRLDPFLFDEPGRYRLNVKTAGNIQLMQRSFEVVQVGSGGAMQAYTGQAASKPAIPAGTAMTRVGLIVGAQAPAAGEALHAAQGSALVLRVANGTGVDRDFELLLYRMATAGGENVVLSDERARIPKGGWIELQPVLLAQEGVYRFVAKSGENDLLLQRTILVEARR